MALYRQEGTELGISGHPEVYPPGEDTFLMLRAVRDELGRVLEIGTGSGIIGIHLAVHGSHVMVTDVNPHALRLATANARQNGVTLDAVRADMFDGICGRFDIIIFNPPYLPTAPQDATGDRWLDASVNGGPDGLIFIRRFLAGLKDHLEPRGRAYIISSSLSGFPARPPRGFKVLVVATEKLEFELLSVHEITRETGDGNRETGRRRTMVISPVSRIP
jgi:release factor glutamine methyltransferase